MFNTVIAPAVQNSAELSESASRGDLLLLIIYLIFAVPGIIYLIIVCISLHNFDKYDNRNECTKCGAKLSVLNKKWDWLNRPICSDCDKKKEGNYYE